MSPQTAQMVADLAAIERARDAHVRSLSARQRRNRQQIDATVQSIMVADSDLLDDLEGCGGEIIRRRADDLRRPLLAAAAEAEAAARATTRALACGRLAAIDHQLACRAALGEKLRRDAHRLGQLDRDADREPPDRLTTAAPPNGPPAPFRPGRDYAAHWNRRAYPADL